MKASLFIRPYVLLIIFLPNLAGCLFFPLPNFSDKPFKNENLISVGVTTRENVKNVFGPPDATLQNDMIYVYAKPNVYMKFYALTEPIKGFGRVSDYQTDHLLIIQFDKNGIVKRTDHIVGAGSETQNGIYVADAGLREKIHILYGTAYAPPYAPFDQMLVLYSPKDIDQRAKQFLVPNGKSAIYVYRETSYLNWFLPENAIVKISLWLDSTPLGDFGPEGFFCLIVDPGPHTLKAVPIYPDPNHAHSGYLKIETFDGEIAFVKQSWEWKMNLVKGEGSAHLKRIIDLDEAREEILKRRMIIDCLTASE